MQSSLSIRVEYRPIKIGWCVHEGNFQELEEAMRFSHTLWGGRHNPIIPISDLTFARKLINTFRVDALYPMRSDPEMEKFIGQFPHLPWPLFHKELFIDGLDGKINTALDVQHPLRFIYEEQQKNLPVLRATPSLFQWDQDDPLSRIFLATMGAYPPPEETGHKYESMFEKYLTPVKLTLNKQSAVPNDLHKRFFPNALIETLLHRDCNPHWEGEGFYYGDANDFEDVVNFWNLRASDIDLFFYDPSHAQRLDGLKDNYTKAILARPSRFGDGKRVAVWGKNHEVLRDIPAFESKGMRCAVGSQDSDGGIWNGLNIKPPVMHFDSQSCLATVSKNQEQPVVSFELPDRPFSRDSRLCHQHAIVSIWPITDLSKGGDWTLQVPYIPELNEYFGRECHFEWNGARAEWEGLGVVIGIHQEIMTLNALRCREVISKTFEAFGMESKPSPAGLICNRLIQQLQGLQGCRVFKISGVRDLIENYGPDQSFTRGGAIQTIRQDNAQLTVSSKVGKSLKHLSDNGAYKIGVELKCEGCLFTFWSPFDGLKTVVSCERCHHEIKIPPHLCERDPQAPPPRFSQFEHLFIESRETPKLSPEDVLKYLVKNGVFRAGLELTCKSCELTFWKHLDDVKTRLNCDYCGNEFDITPQLRDRDWAYRRSGLFGRDDNQAGSIPVTLTLQQLDTFTHMNPAIYSTSMEIEPKTASIDKCETDFVLLTRAHGPKVQIVIGECKTRKEITEQDVANLAKVADAFPRERFDVFILFSKLDGFSEEEIERCKKAQDQYRKRVIMLTDRELEPYFIYERTEKEFTIDRHAISLDDLAKNTVDIFFIPQLTSISA
ncbi:MAG: hypothetical protein HYT77_02230 [Deltaproteobacteria bacterium]|nr:hypothetical protein [Deltaproteobacteria bacterium]